jgi:hypothetical protein
MSAAKTFTSLAAVLLLLSFASAQTARIPDEEGDACVGVDDVENVTYSCNGSADPILWRVGTRQISGSAEEDGIFITSGPAGGGVHSSTIMFTPDFLASMLEGAVVGVACLEQRSLLEVVEADSRTLVVFDAPSPPEDLRVVPTATDLLYDLVWKRPSGAQDCESIVYDVSVRNVETDRLLVNGSPPPAVFPGSSAPSPAEGWNSHGDLPLHRL